jgi:hypothetical protein
MRAYKANYKSAFQSIWNTVRFRLEEEVQCLIKAASSTGRCNTI